MPVLPIRPVDSTGVGDTFVGTLAAWLDQGAELVDAQRCRETVLARLPEVPSVTAL